MDPARERVEQMLEEGKKFSEIDAWIESQTLPEEKKSAVWLLAWVKSQPPALAQEDDEGGGLLTKLLGSFK